MVILLYSKVISIQKVHKKSGVFFLQKPFRDVKRETPRLREKGGDRIISVRNDSL